MTDTTTLPGELVHYGIKGMKWGVRRAEVNKPNANYSRNQQAYDKKNFGNGGAKRVNRRMNKGSTVAEARKQEYKFRRRKSTAVTAAVVGVKYRKQIAEGAKVAGVLVGLAAGVATQKIAVKAETNRGRSSAAATLGLPRTASSGPNYAKQKRGAFNITNM